MHSFETIFGAQLGNRPLLEPHFTFLGIGAHLACLRFRLRGTAHALMDWGSMSDDAKRFRRRAADCRQLAEDARDPRDRELLKDISKELDEEADKIDAEGRG